MKLDRNSRKLLDIIIHATPTIQGKAYDIYEIAPKTNLSKQEFWEILNHLEKEGAIKYEAKKSYFFLTEEGRHYKTFRWQSRKEFLLKSIIVPIVVTLSTLTITNLLQDFLPSWL